MAALLGFNKRLRRGGEGVKKPGGGLRQRRRQR